MTAESSKQLTDGVAQPGEQPRLRAGYDSYRSLADPNLTIFVPEDAVPPLRFKAGGWELTQSSIELNPEAEARVAEQGYLIETKSALIETKSTLIEAESPTSSDELTTTSQGDFETPSLEVEFALVIARMIDSIERRPQDARNIIYELARYKLGEQLLHAKPEERRQSQRALEVAIRNVEIFSEKHAHVLPPVHPSQLNGPDAALNDRRPPPAPELLVRPIVRSDLEGEVSRELHRSSLWSSLTRMAAIVVILAATSIAFQYRERLLSLTDRFSTKQDDELTGEERRASSQVERSPVSVAPQASTMLLPTDYGVYAIINDAPVDLTLIGLTTVLTTPSPTVLPNGRPRFIVFRRDLAATIGDRAEVRILAKIMREFSATVAGKKPVEDAWVVRSISFPFRSSPVKDHPDMTELHSEDPALELPPGRYALVLKAQAYDFSVEGKVVDPRHCIERIVGPVGVTYSSCKSLTER